MAASPGGREVDGFAAQLFSGGDKLPVLYICREYSNYFLAQSRSPLARLHHQKRVCLHSSRLHFFIYLEDGDSCIVGFSITLG